MKSWKRWIKTEMYLSFLRNDIDIIVKADQRHIIIANGRFVFSGDVMRARQSSATLRLKCRMLVTSAASPVGVVLIIFISLR